MNEVIRTSGDIRRLLAETMVEVKNGKLSVDKGLAIASLSKELTGSLQAEVNVAKVRVAMGDAGKAMGKLTHLGKLLINDDSVPTLDGTKD